MRVPQLRCDEDVFALEARDLATKCLLESLRDFLLVSVDLGEIDVTVTTLESPEDGGFNLARLGLPGTES